MCTIRKNATKEQVLQLKAMREREENSLGDWNHTDDKGVFWLSPVLVIPGRASSSVDGARACAEERRLCFTQWGGALPARGPGGRQEPVQRVLPVPTAIQQTAGRLEPELTGLHERTGADVIRCAHQSCRKNTTTGLHPLNTADFSMNRLLLQQWFYPINRTKLARHRTEQSSCYIQSRLILWSGNRQYMQTSLTVAILRDFALRVSSAQHSSSECVAWFG